MPGAELEPAWVDPQWWPGRHALGWRHTGRFSVHVLWVLFAEKQTHLNASTAGARYRRSLVFGVPACCLGQRKPGRASLGFPCGWWGAEKQGRG